MIPSSAPLARWEKWLLLVVFVVALGVRLFYLAEIRSNPFFEHPRLDALFHDTWAQSIAAGNFWGDNVFFRAPLYPYLLGLVYKLFGHSFVVPRILQHFLGTIAVLFVYLLARRLFNATTAVIASLLATFYAVLIYFEGEMLFESFLMFLCLAWSMVVIRALELQKPTWWFYAGFVFGLICATRPPFLVLSVPLFLFMAYTLFAERQIELRRRAITKVILAFFLGVTIPLLPITVRNYYVGKDVVLIASQGGVNFYIGNNQYADGYSSSMPGPLGASWENRDQSFYAEKELGHKPKPSEESWFWYKEGFEFIRTRPIDFIQLTIKKCYLFWNKYEIPNNQSFYSFSQYSLLLRILPVGFWLVGSLGLVGMILAWRSLPARLFIVIILSYALVTVAFFVCDRYRVPIVPLLCIFSAYAVWVMWQKIQMKDWRWLVRVVPVVVLVGLFVNSDLYGVAGGVTGSNPAREYLSLGIVAINQGNYEKAIDHFERCSALYAGIPNLHLNWGVAEWMLGNTAKGIEQFRIEIELFPGSYGALANLSQLFLNNRNVDSALAYGERAIRVKPYMPTAYISTALAYRLSGNINASDSTLHAGLAACGEDFLYGEYLLAGSDGERGRTSLADVRYRSILVRLEKVPQPLYEPEFQYSVDNKVGERKDALKAKVLYGLGHIFAMRGRPDSAMAYFESASRVLPEFSDAWADLGVALLQIHRYDEAAAALNKALALNRENHLYWFNYGTLLGTMGRLPEAQAAFEKSIELQPDFFPARQSLETILKLLH